MFMAKSEYDRGVNTFSPEGRLFQVEYAIQAVKLGSTAVGIRTAEGVVLAVEKRLTSPLLNADSVEKIMEVDSHVGAAMSGLIADARTLVDHARVEAQNHRFTYDEPMQTRALTQAVCDLALSFGEDGEGEGTKMSRPFGVALLVAGYDAVDGPQLYYADPSGTFAEYKAKAMGSGGEGAQSNLQEAYSEALTASPRPASTCTRRMRSRQPAPGSRRWPRAAGLGDCKGSSSTLAPAGYPSRAGRRLLEGWYVLFPFRIFLP